MEAMNNQPQPQPKPQPQQRNAARREAVKARKDKVQQAISGIAANNNIKGMNTNEVIKAYKANNEHVLKALKTLQDSISPITQSSIARFALEKAGAKSVAVLRDKLKQDGIDTTALSNQLLEDLVALDDWDSIYQQARDAIKTYGPPVLKFLWHTFVAPKIGLGGDEGFNSLDWAGNMTNPYRYTFAPGVNVMGTGLSSSTQYLGIHDLVSCRSIKAIICPELFKYRYAYSEGQKSAMAVPNAEYSITTNASGSVGVGIMVRNVVVDGTSYSQSYITIYNHSTFSVTTGTETTLATNSAGILNGSTSAFDSLRHNVTAFTLLPIASLNTAGAFTWAYNNRNGTTPTGLDMKATLAQCKTWPYVTSFNNKTSARFLSVYGDGAEDSFVNNSASSFYQNHYMVIFGSGLPASTEVARLLVTSLVEFIPTSSYMPICQMDFADTGPLTEQFETLMYQRWPILQMLDLPDAKRIAESIPDTPMKYHELFKLLESLVTGIQPREYVPHNAIANTYQLELPGEIQPSFEIE